MNMFIKCIPKHRKCLIFARVWKWMDNIDCYMHWLDPVKLFYIHWNNFLMPTSSQTIRPTIIKFNKNTNMANMFSWNKILKKLSWVVLSTKNYFYPFASNLVFNKLIFFFQILPAIFHYRWQKSTQIYWAKSLIMGWFQMK